MLTDLTLILPDRIGSLAEAMTSFAQANIKIEGCAGFPAWAGEGILHVLVGDVDAARDGLAREGLVIREERDVLITPPLADAADAARLLGVLAGAQVNIDLIYQLRDGRLALGVNRLEQARRVVAEMASAEPSPRSGAQAAVSSSAPGMISRP